jgi:hypothetical protein
MQRKNVRHVGVGFSLWPNCLSSEGASSAGILGRLAAQVAGPIYSGGGCRCAPAPRTGCAAHAGGSNPERGGRRRTRGKHGSSPALPQMRQRNGFADGKDGREQGRQILGLLQFPALSRRG